MNTISTTDRAAGVARSRIGMLLIALAGLLALVGLAAPASASSAYPPAPSCSVAGSPAGSATSITGTGFQPNSPVSVSLGGSHTTVTSNSAGSFATSLGTASGQLTASGTGCVARAAVSALSDQTNDTRPASSTSSSLPNTGADVLGGLAVAAALLVAGALLLVQGRRRHG